MTNIFKVKALIERKHELICIRKGQPLKDALKIMVENEFSQLPIVNKKKVVIGIVTADSIIRELFCHGMEELQQDVEIFKDEKFDVKNRDIAYEKDDIFDHLENLADKAAVLIKRKNNVVGIRTNYDIVAYFRKLTEGFLLIHRIELLLRKIVKSCLKGERVFRDAILKSLKAKYEEYYKREVPAEVNELEFDDYRALISDKENWEKFQNVLRDRNYINKMLEQVRDIRNELMHFRRLASNADKVSLNRCRKYLEECIRGRSGGTEL